MRFILAVLLFFSLSGLAQTNETITLAHGIIKGVVWKGGEKSYHSNVWDTPVITNVSIPTLEVFSPKNVNTSGTAIIIAPGGGLYAHSIESEGRDVAKWLNSKGFTAFVLKYRLVPTGEDGVSEITTLSRANPNEIGIQVAKVLPYAVEDGLNAIKHVRENAPKYGINPSKIGFMGFSAGGAVAMGVSYTYQAASKPNFLVPIYPWTDVMPVQPPKNDTPPTFIVCATNDPLGLAQGSIALYESLRASGKSVALQMYAKGGHGFGMKTQGLPSDDWINRFYEWYIAEEILSKPKN